MSSVTKYTRPDRPGTRWRARYRDRDGSQHERVFTIKADADQWLREQTAALVRGDWADPRSGRVTFRTYAEQWRADQLHHRPATVEQTRIRLAKWVYPVLGGLPIGQIKRSDVQRCVNAAAKHLAPSTVEVVYGTIAGVMKAAVQDRVIATTPCVGIRLPAKASAERVLPLTVAQVQAVADAATGPYAAMVLLGAATGLRSGELRALTADRISPAVHLSGDLRPQQVTITVDRTLGHGGTFGPPKTPASVRTVTVGPSTVAVLADHLATHGIGDHGLLFHLDGHPISAQRAGHAWRAATSGLTVRNRSGWHDLRHHHASLLIASGLSVRAVASRLGHADPSETLRTYAHLWPTDEDRAVEAVEAVMGAR